MILHAKQGVRGRVLDLETHRFVRRVIWFDTDNGVLEALASDEKGNLVLDGNGHFLTVKMKGRFRFIPPGEALPWRTFRMGAPECAECRNALTLPGDDLCPGCRATERGQRNPMRVERMEDGLLLRRPCEHPGCNEPASWSVADEVEVTPAVVGKVVFNRGATVGRRFYCVRHWEPPRLLDAKGEVIDRVEDGGGVRPE